MSSDLDVDLDDIPAETPLSPEEAIIRRHRREKKELQGKIVAMKKNVTKGDKKKKKELADEIAKLEADLEARHKVELDTFRPKRLDFPPAQAKVEEEEERGEEANESHDEDNKKGKQSKAQKRREKKAAQEKERQLRMDQETAELVEGADWKVEDEQLVELLNGMKLQVHDIQSDGHCLYRAISHQLGLLNENLTVEDLRSQTALYLREHKEEFINYLVDLDGNTDGGFDNYCTAVADTAAWGGDVELRALSQLLKRPIKVIQADGPAILFGEEFNQNALVLTYHRHKYKLGAHYNSVIPTDNNPTTAS